MNPTGTGERTEGILMFLYRVVVCFSPTEFAFDPICTGRKEPPTQFLPYSQIKKHTHKVKSKINAVCWDTTKQCAHFLCENPHCLVSSRHAFLSFWAFSFPSFFLSFVLSFLYFSSLKRRKYNLIQNVPLRSRFISDSVVRQIRSVLIIMLSLVSSTEFPWRLIGSRDWLRRWIEPLRHWRTTDCDVTIGQCVVSSRNSACVTLIRHRPFFNGELSQSLSA